GYRDNAFERVELIKQLGQRLPDNIRVLQSISFLSADECLKPIKSDILGLAHLFTEDSSTLTKIDFQWKKLHHTIWTETSNTLKLWSEVANYRDATGENPYHDLAEIALTALSLPHSNADVERTFSNMNFVKSKLRNKMKLSTLKAILTIKYGLKRQNTCCASYELPSDILRKIGTVEAYSYKISAREPEPSTLHASSSTVVHTTKRTGMQLLLNN
ncbi:putative hAT family C-terminal dimerization region-containing protein 13, partial [Homarus americanus]